MPKSLRETMADTVIYNGKIVDVGEYIIENQTELTVSVCTFVGNSTFKDHAFWKSKDPLAASPPFFLIQLSIMILLIQLFTYLLRPIRQPRFLPPLIACIVVGPTALGRIVGFGELVHPLYTTLVLSTLGNLSLVYYMFLAGFEMDLTTIRRIERKAKVNAIAGVVIPLVMGATLFQLVSSNITTSGSLFWGISLTVTSFPDLARILSDMKILHTDLGKLALSSATISDLASWGLSVLAITFLNERNKYEESIFVVVFILLCWFVGRPALCWIIQRINSEHGKPSELLMYAMFSSVVMFGLITDALGAHSMIGGFMFGLIMPNGEFKMSLMEKLDDLLTGILVPAFFMNHGLRFTLLGVFDHSTGIARVVVVILLCCSFKIISTLIVSKIYGMSTREGLALGALMNVKGVLALIIMNAGNGLKGFDQQTFTMMTIAMIVMTLLVKPIAMISYNSTKAGKKFHRIFDQTIGLDSELRVIACIHSHRNLPGLIRLLEVSNANERCPVCVFATHLVKLTERRASAMLIIQDGTRNIPNDTSHQTTSREEEEANHIMRSFEIYESRGESVSFEPVTVVSPYDTMHEDICSLALEKRVALILVPFHKQSDVDGRLLEDNSEWQLLNQKILKKATCAVGIFVDRGLGSHMQDISRFTMVFLGGPHDRVALTYAWRMAASTDVILTVYRFLPIDNMDEDEEEESYENLNQNEKQLDDEFINDFRFKTTQSQSIKYVEIEGDSGEQIMRTLRLKDGCDLYIIGREQTFITKGMEDWNAEEKDLGVLGDTLVESDFAEQSSVLVIQQYDSHEAKGSSRWSATHRSDQSRIDREGRATSWRSPFGIDHTIV